MNNIGAPFPEDVVLEEEPKWQADAIVEQIWRELDGAVSREDICRELSEVASAYQDASVQTYVPVFIRRDVLRRLRNTARPKSTGVHKR